MTDNVIAFMVVLLIVTTFDACRARRRAQRELAVAEAAVVQLQLRLMLERELREGYQRKSEGKPVRLSYMEFARRSRN